jgi:DNA-binding MarR family transcriptional regulator
MQSISPPTGPWGRPVESAEEAVLALMMQVGKRFHTRHANDRIDPSIMAVLHILDCHDGMRLTDLAGKMHLDASTVSRHVKHLEDHGLVIRASDPDDRRATQVAISDSGRGLLAETIQRRLDALREVLSHWSDEERDTLQHVLTKLAADLQAASRRDLENS